MTRLLRQWRFGRLYVMLEAKPQDCWIGLFWRVSPQWVDVWVCLLPMLPFHFAWCTGAAHA